MKLTTVAIVSAAVIGLASTAYAQQGGRANNPELERQPGTMTQPAAPSGGTGATKGQGTRRMQNPQINDSTGNAGNNPPDAGGEGRVNTQKPE